MRFNQQLAGGQTQQLHFKSYSTTQHVLGLSPPAIGQPFLGNQLQSWSVVLLQASSWARPPAITVDSDASRGAYEAEANNVMCWHGSSNPNAYSMTDYTYNP